MRRPIAFLAAVAIAAAIAGEARAVTNVFEYPLVFRRQQQLSAECQLAIRRRDYAEMERVCRAGAALLPENPTWRYNLGCALARQGRSSEAFAALNRALDLGFRDESLLGSDADLTSLRPLPAYVELLDKAHGLRSQPGEGQSPIVPAPILDGLAHVHAANTRWDIDGGFFRAFFLPPTNLPPPAEFAARWNGPAAELIRPWLATNAAAGNFGDFYDNRDDGHSQLDLAPFAGLTPIVYDADARRHNAHYGLNQFLYNGVVFGNASVAFTAGPYWHSVPRGAMLDGALPIAFLAQQYLRNHIYCYPSHRDHDANGLGDLFPLNQPYVLISQGSSGSDQPFLRAIAATLAAFRPETKRFLTASGLIAPTVQMLLRASQKQVAGPQDYLDGAAHPTAFDAANLDVVRMVRLAHELTTNDIPPLVALRVVEEAHAVPGVDFLDVAGSEILCDTPCAIGRILRGPARRHTLLAGAQMIGLPAEGWSLRWVVLRGDPSKVIILPRKPDQSLVEISVFYHDGRFPVRAGSPLQSGRVDIGVFAVRGQQVSAPAFFSFLHLNNELRTYAADGHILVMDYAAATNRYEDPRLSLPKRWRDEYEYNDDRQLTGWTRHLDNGAKARFNARGERVEQTDKLGRPIVTRPVNYLPRTALDGATVPDLICVDSEFCVRYRYDSDSDRTGVVAGRERAGP